MKLEPVTKLDQKKKTKSEKIDDDVMSANCDVIVIFRFMVNFKLSGAGFRMCSL